MQKNTKLTLIALTAAGAVCAALAAQHTQQVRAARTRDYLKKAQHMAGPSVVGGWIEETPTVRANVPQYRGGVITNVNGRRETVAFVANDVNGQVTLRD